MKKLFTLFAAALMAVANADAQTVAINKTDGTKLVFNAAEIEKIEFSAAEEEANLLHEFKGYILVTTGFFQNKYYGYDAKIAVYTTPSGKVTCTFSDPQWGEGQFSVTMGRGTMSGNGTLTITDPRTGQANAYSATLEGGMTNFNITLPDLMGGTTINWVYAKAEPMNYAAEGKYEGTDNITVIGQNYTSNAPVAYQTTANADGTINLVVPEITYEGTPLGTIVVGTYTIPNISYDEKEKAFVKAYKDDKVSFHFKSSTMDGDYTMDSDVCRVVVSKDADGRLVVSNDYQVGRMPFPISGAFTGTKK